MAVLSFSIDEARDILRANGMLPEHIRDVQAGHDGLRVTVIGGIEIQVRRESFAGGVLRLAYSSASWAFKLADMLGKVDAAIDEAIRDYPYLRREDKSLLIDLNWALQTRIKGIQVKIFELGDNSIKIEF